MPDPDALSAPLIGREREWSVLKDRCRRLERSGGGLFWIAGETGIGKSATLAALHSWAEGAGFAVLHGRHVGHRQAPPLHAVREAFGQLIGLSATTRAGPVVEGALRRWPDLLGHRKALVRFLEPLAVSESDLVPSTVTASSRLFYVVFRLLAAAAQDRPVVVLLDDCHWADPLTLELLDYLAGLLGDHPALLIGAYRLDEPDPPERLADLVVTDSSESLILPRLDLLSVTRMARAHHHEAEEAFCRQLYALTEGVPLFVQQLLLDVEPGDEPFRATLPEPIVRTISRRLRSLDETELELVRTAAVFGAPFEASRMAALTGWPLARVLELLAPLESRHHVLVAEPEPTAARFRFQHGLIRQVLYDEMPRSLRQRLHGRIGEALESECDERPEAVFQAAHHLEESGLGDRAIILFRRAGDQARLVHADEEARNYYRQAMAAEKRFRTHPDRATILEALADSCSRLGEPEEARTCWEEALDAQPDPLRRSTLCWKLGCSWGGSDTRKATRILRRGLRESEAHPHSLERALVLCELRWHSDPAAATRKEALELSARRFAEALRIARRHANPEVEAHILLQDSQTQLGRRNANLARKDRLISRGLRLARSAENWDLVVEGHVRLALNWRPVDLQRAIGEGERALALSEEYQGPGHQLWIVQLLLQVSWAMQDRSRIEEYGPRARELRGPADGGRPRHRMQRGYYGSLVDSFSWATQPDEAWSCLTSMMERSCRNEVLPVVFGRLYSRLERVARHVDRSRDLGTFLDDLRAAFPAYLSRLRMDRWAPKSTDRVAADLEGVGAEALSWFDEMGFSRRRHSDGAVEIEPGPGTNIGNRGAAPCLLRRVAGDFVLETRVAADSPARRAGGLVAWDESQRLVRFASGVDHVGQLSLGWHDGEQMGYECLTHLPDSAPRLRLERRDRRVAGYVCVDGRWWSCGELDFTDGPVEVGLYAEANFEFDFPQPFPIRFQQTVLQAAQLAGGESNASTSYLFPLPEAHATRHGMVGAGAAFRRLCSNLEETARSSLPLLICGESGVGKELAARAVHDLSGRRGRYIPVNVGALPPTLVESELFGHRRGAFTGATESREGLFAAAEGGTIFLDEIGELPFELQRNLLRVLDTGEVRPLGATAVRRVDTRIVAATNRDLTREVEAGSFREDLYFRFAEPLLVPPLRDRTDDIAHLVARFIEEFAGGRPLQVTRAAMERLQEQAWPDNIRGLRQVVERAVNRAGDGPIEIGHLSLRGSRRPRPSARSVGDPEELRRVAAETGGNVAAMARHFGVSRPTVYSWCRTHGLDLQAIRAERSP